VPALHQNHDYGHIVQATANGIHVDNPECRENLALMDKAFPWVWGGSSSLTAAGWRMGPTGGIRRNITRERFRWYLLYWRIQVQRRLAIKEWIARAFGEKTLQCLLAVRRQLRRT
jgi:hypothetical protein